MKSSLYTLLVVLILVGCTRVEPRRPLTQKTYTSLASTAKDLRRINQLEDKKIKTLMQLDSTTTYINSNQGFWYAYVSKSTDTLAPKYGDKVTYNLEIRDLNNAVIYAASDLGVQHYLVDKQDLMTGLQQGIKLLHKGDQVKFLIPSYNAFGVVGDQNKIGTNQSIIAIVTLQTIN